MGLSHGVLVRLGLCPVPVTTRTARRGRRDVHSVSGSHQFCCCSCYFSFGVATFSFLCCFFSASPAKTLFKSTITRDSPYELC